MVKYNAEATYHYEIVDYDNEVVNVTFSKRKCCDAERSGSRTIGSRTRRRSRCVMRRWLPMSCATSVPYPSSCKINFLFDRPYFSNKFCFLFGILHFCNFAFYPRNHVFYMKTCGKPMFFLRFIKCGFKTFTKLLSY